MRYYIVDDNLATVKSLANIISSRKLGEVIGYSTDPEAAISEIMEDRPDIVLVDLLMGGMDGITLVQNIRSRRPDISFVSVDFPQPDGPTNATLLPGSRFSWKSSISGLSSLE